MFEAMESRRLMAVSYDPVTDVVTQMSPAVATNDSVVVEFSPAGVKVSESIGGGAFVTTSFNFAATPVSNVVVSTQAGNDSVRILNANRPTRVWAGAGDDTVVASMTVPGMSAPLQLFGEAGNDKLFAANGNDLLRGGSGNDELRGGAGNDSLVGETGNDRHYGGDGNDFIDARDPWQADFVDGGNGFDTVWAEINFDTVINSEAITWF